MRVLWLLTLVVLALLAGCLEVKLPSEEAMSEVFAPRKTIKLTESPAPANIPILATSELADWHALCNQCHVGPRYSSYTVLNWGHRESCVQNMTCHDCHSRDLHRTDVRGDKARCIDCHMERSISIDCKTCHDAGWRDKHDPHPGPVGQTHVMAPDWQEIQCLKCHGSERWCTDCHGLPMPHPKDIVKIHPTLVEGKPDVCTNCHGTEACIRCHRKAGVKFPGGRPELPAQQ